MTKINVQGVKGTDDFYPGSWAVMQWMMDAYRDQASKYGFQEVEAPAMEYLSTLTEKEGDEIKQQIFVLEKKGNEQLGLRFDLTVPTTRMFIAKQRELPKPVKWSYITRMWRYEQPQKGRMREFYQYGVELFGSASQEADAEVIKLAIDSLCALGLTSKDFVVKINNRKLLQGLLEGLGVKDITQAITAIDKINKIPKEAFHEELKKAGLTSQQVTKVKKILSIKDLKEVSKLKLNATAKEGYEELKKVFSALDARKKCIQLDLSIARGLAYYTGTGFEIFDKELKYRALCGGGRYDEMVKSFGGQPCPATGFGMGFSTVQLLLQDKGLLPQGLPGPEYYIAVIEEEGSKGKGRNKVTKKAMELVDTLRKKTSVDFDIMGRSLGKQLDYANKINAQNVIVLGEQEVTSGKVKVKDMRTGKEKKVEMGKL
jgi:histidyl-tRNA synthetase